MIKKILIIIIFTISLFSCNKKSESISYNDDLIRESTTQNIVRPIPKEKLEKLEDSIRLYYNKLNDLEIWYNKENRTDLILEISNSSYEGLNPKDYNIDQIEVLEQKRESLNDDEIINYDILLTNSFKKLATHLYKGKLNPRDVYNDWDLIKKELPLSDSLTNAIKERKIKTLFHNLKPQHLVYKKIKNSLILLEKYPDITFKNLSFVKKIEPNDSVNDVITIKKILSYWKDYNKRDSIITAKYDSVTIVAIKKFQLRHGLKPDGIIGNGTYKALNFSKEERKQQIIANLERWKWFPYDFGEEYILVNLPNYSLNYVVKNDTVATHTIVVGKKSRKTPVLTSKISNLVYNPTWTVPPTIIKEDLTPSATKNREYFSRNNMTIYSKSGEKIAAEDWNPELSKSYRYVQAPSYNNSLGQLKFNFPNKHSVYLHDTNHRDYFSREYKALSSGCVRVENPLALGEKILEHENKEWQKSEIDTILKRKNTKIIPIKNNINVLLLYWTNWSDGNQLIFREDIYNLDKILYDKLRN